MIFLLQRNTQSHLINTKRYKKKKREKKREKCELFFSLEKTGRWELFLKQQAKKKKKRQEKNKNKRKNMIKKELNGKKG